MKTSNSKLIVPCVLSVSSIFTLLSCSQPISIGQDHNESIDDASEDPLAAASQPKHPVRRWHEEQQETQQRAQWASKAQKAKLAQDYISVGDDYSCAKNAQAEVKCWGFANAGGNGIDSSKKDITNYFSAYTGNLKQVSVASGASCLVTKDSRVKCHGSSWLSQLGDGLQSDSFKAVVPVGLDANISEVTSGSYRFCAVKQDGGLWCWGWGFGDTPSEVFGSGMKFVRVALGSDHHCAISTDFRAQCWGSNDKGQLGIGKDISTSKNSPIPVAGLQRGVVQTAVGNKHSCALSSQGGVKCWGWNSIGQLGNGTTADSSSPVDVAGLEAGVVSIAASSDTSCALLESGTLKCWGANASGQLGNGNTENKDTPVEVSALKDAVKSFSMKADVVCAIDKSDVAWCWGKGSSSGRLGNGASQNSSVPVKVNDF